MSGINGFFKHYEKQLKESYIPEGTILEHQEMVMLKGERIPVSISYTSSMLGAHYDENDPEGDIFESSDTEPEEKRSSVLYQLKISLDWMPIVFRRLLFTGDSTLEELHLAIQGIFDWDNDHMYSFFLSGKAWDRETEYSTTEVDEKHLTYDVTLDQLKLSEGKQFMYLFDYGDELRHNILVEKITPNGVKDGVNYPRLVDVRGEAPSQYDVDDDSEDDGLADGFNGFIPVDLVSRMPNIVDADSNNEDTDEEK
jgi:hypothetical protein